MSINLELELDMI